MIADGHHRYEAALRHHEEDGGEETAYVLAALVSCADPGLTIFPTHRLVSGTLPELNGGFELTPVPGGASEALDRLATAARDRPAFVLAHAGRGAARRVVGPARASRWSGSTYRRSTGSRSKA